jgi:TetR/AcrR family transcriptional repressor of nem operon
MSSICKNPVGRPRCFEEDDVLKAAMGVFWHQGYESTSMFDLMEATGLHKGSLYQAFGDKHTLFVKSLRYYILGVRCEMSALLNNAASAIEGLRAAVHKAIDMACDGEHGNPGCLALNTLVEKGTGDEEIMAVLQEELNHRMAEITRAVEQAQREGDIRKGWAPERIAGMIHTVVAGLTVNLKGPLEPVQAKAMADDFLTTLA